MINESGACAYAKQLADGDTALWTSVEIELSADHAVHMMGYHEITEEFTTWLSECKSFEVIEEFGANDKLVKWNLNVPWAMKYVFSIPDTIYMRQLLRKDFPEAGAQSWLSVPYDGEKRVPVEAYGAIKLESGCFIQDPVNPNKCTLYSMNKADLSMVPNFGIKMMLRKEMIGKFNTMVQTFKKSKHFETLSAK